MCSIQAADGSSSAAQLRCASACTTSRPTTTDAPNGHKPLHLQLRLRTLHRHQLASASVTPACCQQSYLCTQRSTRVRPLATPYLPQTIGNDSSCSAPGPEACLHLQHHCASWDARSPHHVNHSTTRQPSKAVFNSRAHEPPHTPPAPQWFAALHKPRHTLSPR